VTIDRATGVARHTGTLLLSELRPGDAVTVSVDPEHRRILSECHTAGHVVDSAVERAGKLMKPVKGYHFLDGPYVEYQGTVPAEERDDFLRELQAAFRQLVEEDIPTKIDLMSKERADELCNRRAQNFDMDAFADPTTREIRVVTVAGYPCPCGGTHVRSTADLRARGWGVMGLKSKNKGVIRVKYGQNAAI
jgi:Ser-tRNA(Ala) deacylase AlaX